MGVVVIVVVVVVLVFIGRRWRDNDGGVGWCGCHPGC